MLALLRSLLRPMLTRSALWDGAASGNRTANWTSTARSANSYFDNPAIMRARAEREYRNNPYARRAVDALVNAAVGASGINPQFTDRLVQAAWERWSGYSWAPFVSEALQTVIVSGEAFVLLAIDDQVDGVPLRPVVLGPEHLDTSRIDRDTYDGISYANGRPAGYWLYRRNPVATQSVIAASGLLSEFVSAADCLHVFRPIAAGAQRGQTWLAPVLLALRELGEYLEAALVKAKVSALFTGYVRTPDGSNPLATNGTPTLEPGSMTRLNPGEELEFTEPPDAGATFDPFVRAQLRRIAAGVGIPYEVLSGDLSQVTFASGRHGLLEFRRTIEAIQYNLLVPRLCEPILRRWARIAAALSEIDAEPGKVRWIAPGISMLDEGADVRATIARIRGGLISRSEAVAAMGWRAEDIDAELAADNARADRLGLTLDSDPRKTTAQGQQQQELPA